MNQSSDPIEFLCKEVYARFGLAYYLSECLHRGLCSLYVFYNYRDKADTTRARTEELQSIASKMTFGQILERTKEFQSDEINNELDEVLKIRNFLAHHFWFNRIHLMAKEAGLMEMIEELEGFASFFQDINARIKCLVQEKIKEYGIKEYIDDLFKKAKKGEMDEEQPLLEQRMPKKKEKVIRAWDVPLEGGSTIVLETDDGCLWQFCDAGLGWTFYEEVGTDWKINKKIKKYLPAFINPRPEIKVPWNFEFSLDKRAVLFVKKRMEDKIYRWGIRL